ncbi:MAG: NUDIX domain-containing protein [Spirochaetales bacterium]|nr:NUDIX domain-containing protein [Spirochaetales bacterium]
MNEEMLPLVDENGRFYGTATRARCHSNPRLLHPVVHLHVFDAEGRIYLQRRALTKDLFPGYWDTSVGGHVAAGETIGEALAREGREELDIDTSRAVFLFTYIWRNENESEYVYSYKIICDGHILPPPEEVIEGRFFTVSELKANAGNLRITPNFIHELRLLQSNRVV